MCYAKHKYAGVPRFFGLLLAKDLIMLALGGWLVKKAVHIEGARWFGKVTTVLFYVVMAAIIFFPGIPGWGVALMLGAVTVPAFAAGVMYIPQFRGYQKQARAVKNPRQGGGKS